MVREALAEAMIPVIGQLYRDNNVVTSIHGRSLVNKSTMNILKAHRFARRVDKDELLLEETAPLLNTLAQLELGPAAIDIALLNQNSRKRGTMPPLKTSSEGNSPGLWASAALMTAPAPTSCSTALAGSAGSWPAS